MAHQPTQAKNGLPFQNEKACDAKSVAVRRTGNDFSLFLFRPWKLGARVSTGRNLNSVPVLIVIRRDGKVGFHFLISFCGIIVFYGDPFRPLGRSVHQHHASLAPLRWIDWMQRHALLLSIRLAHLPHPNPLPELLPDLKSLPRSRSTGFQFQVSQGLQGNPPHERNILIVFFRNRRWFQGLPPSGED